MPQEYELKIIILIYMYTGIEQLSKWVADGGSQILTVGIEFTDKQGEEAKMIHIVMG